MMLNKNACLNVILCVLLCLTGPAVARSVESADVIIESVTVIDAHYGSRPDMTVVLRGDKIIEVVPAKEARPFVGARTIDGRGKYLIPGLWDAHVHLTFDPELSSSMFNLLLGMGITSVRDTGGELSKVLAWREKSRTTLAPTVYVAGPLIDGEPTIYNGEVSGFPELAVTARSPAEVERLVDELAAKKVDLIKAYEMLTPESFKALISRARHHGIPVTGHVPLSMTVEQASNAGLRSMEHFRNLEMACSKDRDDLLAQRINLLKNAERQSGSALRSAIHSAQHYAAVQTFDAERCASTMKVLAENNTWQIPTLTLMLASSIPYYAEDKWRATFEYLPAEVASKWLAAAASYKKKLETPSVSREQRKAVADWKMNLIPKLVEREIPIMAGTDTPIFFLTPGFSLHRELETLVIAGMTPMQALEAATLAPAKYFKREHKQGLIAPEMLADLVLLNADPLQDISNTTKIELVIRGGVVLSRPQLDAMLLKASVLE